MPIQFASVGRLDGDDVVMMTDALMLLLETCGRSWPPPARALLSRARGALSAPTRSTEGPACGDEAPRAVVTVPTERLLDAASFLLDAAQLLHRHGAPLAALAVEGVEGRLLEAALDAGRVERSA